MTLAALFTLLKIIATFAAGWIANGKLTKAASSQAANQTAEAKASDPVSGNDVTDLDQLK